MGFSARDHCLFNVVMISNNSKSIYDCAIIGGGVSGLCLSIQLAMAGHSVVLFEKNEYPIHKVCGEYISMESWDFLVRLGLPLGEMNLPVIDQLGISSASGFMLNHTLKMGGFGISRYTLDETLSQIAREKGVMLLTNCRVSGLVDLPAGLHSIQTSKGEYTSRVVCGSFGKYTPAFLQDIHAKKKADYTNYIGVKYHIKTDLAHNRIELHNFENGYCGISKVDQGWYCLCYLTTAANLLKHNKNIKTLEESVLYRNPFLKRYFTQSEFVYEDPLVISNIHFHEKQSHQDGIFLLGDTAGTITPLCGNGMSMGMRASVLLGNEIENFLNNKQSKQQTLDNYQRSWTMHFGARIKTGYYLQNLFGKNITTALALRFLSNFPGVTSKLVSLTHGQRF